MSSSAKAKGGQKSASAPVASTDVGVPTMISIGYGNLVAARRVVSIVSPGSSPMRRLREAAGEHGKLIDATEGRRTRSILVTDSDHVILSAINPETIAARLQHEGIEEAGS